MSERLSVAEVAERVGLATNTIRQYTSDGRFPKPDGKFSGVNFWFTETVDEWAANR